MEITITHQHTEERKVNVPTPCFWKSLTGTTFVGILDEKTAIEFYEFKGTGLCINHGTPQQLSRQLALASECYDLCDESEFMNAWADAYDSINLRPQLSYSDTVREIIK